MIPEPFHHEAATDKPIPGERSRVYLLPGELHVAAHPCQITTILGSCVAVCLWDPQRKAGGMNHFLLPAWRESKSPSLRFGDLATHALLKKLMDVGCRRQRLTAKIFGGAALFQPENRQAASLGAQNVEAAQLIMKNCGIAIIAQDTGGRYGRKIIFNTDDGSVWSRPI